MDTKRLIIIGILVIIICILTAAIYGLLSQNTEYERIEIVPNGTSIEIPTNNAKYLGDTNGVKFWNWTNGALVTYNSQEGSNAFELTGALGFYAIKELVKTGESETIDDITIYKLDSSKLSDSINTTGNGEFYCVHLVNDTTHDNIVICCKDKDVVLHMAKSIIYKTSNTTDNPNDNITNTSTANNTPSSNPQNTKDEELPVSYYSQHPEEDYDDYDDYDSDDYDYYEYDDYDDYEEPTSGSSSSSSSSSSGSSDSGESGSSSSSDSI